VGWLITHQQTSNYCWHSKRQIPAIVVQGFQDSGSDILFIADNKICFMQTNCNFFLPTKFDFTILEQCATMLNEPFTGMVYEQISFWANFLKKQNTNLYQSPNIKQNYNKTRIQ